MQLSVQGTYVLKQATSIGFFNKQFNFTSQNSFCFWFSYYQIFQKCFSKVFPNLFDHKKNLLKYWPKLSEQKPFDFLFIAIVLTKLDFNWALLDLDLILSWFITNKPKCTLI